MRRLAWSTPPTSADDMDNRLADLEVRLYAVMLEQNDVGVLLVPPDVRETFERAG